MKKSGVRTDVLVYKGPDSVTKMEIPDKGAIRGRQNGNSGVDEKGTLAAVRLAVELGADLDAVDGDGNTALHHVVDKGFDQVVMLLAERGADLNVPNGRGQSPLAIVVRGRTGNTEAASATAELLRELRRRTDRRTR